MTWIFAVISGVLFGASLPPNPFGPLEWVALAPLFLAARRSGPIKAYLLGVLAIFTAALLLIVPIRTPEELGNGGGGCALFALLLGWTCAFGAAMKVRSPWKWSLGVAAAGVLGEWLTHTFFPLYAAMGQWRNPYIMPVASWVGIWGVSFLIYGFNAALAVALDHALPSRGGVLKDSRQKQVAGRFALGGAAGLLALHLLGWAQASRPMTGKPLRVAAIQPDAEEYLPLLQRAKAEGAQVVVWPELALTEPLGKDVERYLVPGLYQVIGYGGSAPEEGLPENFTALLSPEGKVIGRYSKIHLFGSEREVHKAGKVLGVVDSPLGRSGLAICYDTMFTEVVRGLVKQGSQVIYVPNMDPSATRGALHALHAAATVFRAAENGVPLVRSEWRGYSMIIDGKGRILENAGMTSPVTLVADVTLPARPGTLYTRLGDVFPFLCLILLVGVIFMDVREEKRRKAREKAENREALPTESEELAPLA